MKSTIIKRPLKKYQCQGCFRNNFDRPIGHKCRGGYTKKNLIWHVYFAPDRVVLIEKKSKENNYKNLIQNVLNLYAKTYRPINEKKNI